MFEGSWQKHCASGTAHKGVVKWDCVRALREGKGGAGAGSAEVFRYCAWLLIFAVCRHLVALYIAAVKFGQALRAAIELLTSDVMEGGSCTTGQSSISAQMFARERERHGGDHGWIESC